MRLVSKVSWSNLRELPVGIFSIVLGYAGLSISLQKAIQVVGVSSTLPCLFGLFTLSIFVVLTCLYIAKAIFHFRAVAAELEDPVNMHFFPTISISLMLLSILLLSSHVEIAKFFFLAGAPLQLLLTLLVLHLWLNRSHFELNHVTPAWFIPAVGNAIAPISGVSLGFTELAWLCFSVGFVFWLLLLPIVFNRMLFGLSLSDELAPTLCIMLAPPAINFISYVALTGTVDAAAQVLYFFSLFIAMFLATQLPRLARLEFSLTWWAYSFPVAAVTTASWLMFEKTHVVTLGDVAIGLQALLTIIVAILTVATLVRVVRRWPKLA